MSETLSGLLINPLGSLLLSAFGLPIAFLSNTAGYLVASGSLWTLPDLSQTDITPRNWFSSGNILKELWEGVVSLAASPALLILLLLTACGTQAGAGSGNDEKTPASLNTRTA